MSFERDFNEPKDRYFAAEDLDFTSGDSPVVLDVSATIVVGSIDGEIICRNTSGNVGNILVEFSSDGTNYDSQFTVFNDDSFSLYGLKIKKIRITHSGTDSGYRVFAR